MYQRKIDESLRRLKIDRLIDRLQRLGRLIWQVRLDETEEILDLVRQAEVVLGEINKEVKEKEE